MRKLILSSLAVLTVFLFCITVALNAGPTKQEIYRAWWAETEKCSGLVSPAAQFEDVEFFVVEPDDSSGFYVLAQGPFVGWSDIWNDNVYLDRRHAMDRGVVKHEMLHQLIGKPGHGPMFDLCAD
jgi:hypothetical protein